MKDKGTIIILNGPSSCGKTTLSKNLQKIWKTPLYHLSYDIVEGYMTPRTFPFADENEAEHDFLTVMYVSAAAIAKTGRDVVIDNCLFDTQDIYEISREIMHDCDTVFVRIKISEENLARRERERGNRAIGKALWQNEHITPKDDSAYDVIVSTDEPSEACAEKIAEYVTARSKTKN